MNLWERAKKAVRDFAVYSHTPESYSAAIESARALLADMERVECVEGGAYTDGPEVGSTVEADFAAYRNVGDRPALLLLLEEPR